MDKKDFLKKYWFLCVVALGLIVFFVFYSIQAIKDRPVYVNAKSEDGKSVVYTLNGENYYADDLYEDLKDDINRAAYFKWSMEVIDKAVKTDDELNQYASNYASYLSANNEEKTIDNYLKQYGYENGVDDLYLYSLHMVKADQIYFEFYKNNYDKYVPNVIRDLQPKKVSHILIKLENVEETTDESGNTIHVAKPTDEEKAKLEEVIKALETDKFEDVAKKYSDDGTSEKGGLLGIYDSQTAPNTFVKEFADAVVTQEYGSVSIEPIVSEFGYHFVKIDEPTKDELVEDDAFMSEVSTYYSYAGVLAVKQKSDELGFVIVDENLKKTLDEYCKAADSELNYYSNLESEVYE